MKFPTVQIWITLSLAFTDVCWSQEWPRKQAIKVVSPFIAGAAPEVLGRPIFEHVSKQLGQTVVWENRAGAGGTVGAAAVAKADPDGYTLLANTAAHTVAPAIYANLRFDTNRDFIAIAPFGHTASTLIVPPARYKTLAELLATASSKPGSINYGSAGLGSSGHFTAEKLLLSAGFQAVHVPFKGAPDTIREIVGNRIDFTFAPLAAVKPLMDSNDVRGLAVMTAKRATLEPNLPTIAELGLAKAQHLSWTGAFAPSGTSNSIVQRLNAAILSAVADLSLNGSFAKLGAEPLPMSSEQFGELVRTEIENNINLVKAAGIKVN